MPLRRTLMITLTLVGALACAYYTWHQSTARTTEELLADASTAWDRGEFDLAYADSVEVLNRTQDSPIALSIAGMSLLELGRCSDAEALLKRAVQADLTNRRARLSLVRLLRFQGRFSELRPHALALLRQGDSGNEFLLPLAAPDELRLSAVEFDLAARCQASVPDDPAPKLGIARHDIQTGHFSQAISLLREIHDRWPDHFEAMALLGTALLEIGDRATFREWLSKLPQSADSHAEIWFLRGVSARADGHADAAIRCYWETLQRDPNHRRAHHQLIQSLAVAGMLEESVYFGNRFKLLEEVSRLATRGNDASAGRLSARTMRDIGQLMESLGRMWEASAWYRKAIEAGDKSETLRLRLAAVSKGIDPSTPLTLESSRPASSVDLSSFPLPAVVTDGTTHANRDKPDTTRIALVDKAAASGLIFSYYNDANPSDTLARMFEFSGGGVAVLDYDGDLWPDVYLTQGCEWPPGSGQHERHDRLYRNISGKRFEDVTEKTRLGDTHYSQGITVGDFDNDGFPDLYLANIGSNRLYHNNGDGTFTDISSGTNTAGDAWTLSCVLADLNGDALPDIYTVNYLSGNDVFDRRCLREGVPIQCPLHYFPSAQDRFQLNPGDGQFSDMTDESGIRLPEGKGMGVVAAMFSPERDMSVFVANDDKPNFFFINSQPDPGAVPRFYNAGVMSGLAFDDRGASNSCMGVASGDINNDGLLDLYVTNFTHEHNNLYIQRMPGVFEDRARHAKLHTATIPHMGWGTQFLDVDLDGWLDILVANGHLDGHTSGPLPYRMPTQLFRNQSDGTFVEHTSDTGYLGQLHVGRAVARIDWNRDGRPDACVTHVDEPVALLTNESSGPGRFLAIRLRGVNCSRDAIGSLIRVTAGERVVVRHVSAGDGFQASNERKTIFGLGDADRIDKVTIHWPSGSEQVLHDVQLDSEIIVIENQLPQTVTSGDGQAARGIGTFE